MHKRLSVLSAVLLFLALGSPHAQSSTFAVDLTWDGTKSCFDPRSPPFSLSGVPAGTRRLRFVMKDLDAPDFTHGGGSIAYDGQPRIARGAFSYRGPCPPQGQHRYQWMVEAQDASGRTLAVATVT